MHLRQIAAAGEKGCAAKDVQQELGNETCVDMRNATNGCLASLLQYFGVQHVEELMRVFSLQGMGLNMTQACGVEGPRLTTLLTALTAVLEA